LEVFAVVLGVALRTFDTAVLVAYNRRVITAIGGQSLNDFFMTIQTAEFRCTDLHRVARDTTGWTAQVFMRP
jgi:hypothetical protein